jgi:iron(III) transport system ATP-binding protein
MIKPTKPGLLIEKVSHSYGPTTVVRDASLTVGPGQVHCLLGPSGSGKTTLLRLVSGLERVQSGRIGIFGEEVGSPARHTPPEKRLVGFVFQDYALFPHLTVRDNVCFGIAGRRRKARIERARTLLDNVGMADFERAMPNTLSGGQQQRVALARALGRDPAVMLLDEPFSGLDVQLRDEVRSATIDVLQNAQVATLMVTHDPHEAMMVADRISIIHDGHIEQSGTPEELYLHPVNERVASSLGEVNCFECQVKGSEVATPFGSIATSSFNDGDRVRVILRPKSIEIVQQEGDSVEATVVSSQHLGDSLRIATRLTSGERAIVVAPTSQQAVVDSRLYLSISNVTEHVQVVKL